MQPMSFRLGHPDAIPAARNPQRSVTRLRELCETPRRNVRAKFRGLLVPLTGLCDIGRDADGAALMHDKRVKCFSKHQGGIGAPGLGGSPEQQPRCGEIAILEKILGAIDECGDLVVVELQDRAGSLCPRRLQSGNRPLPNLTTRHLRWGGFRPGNSDRRL